MPIDVDPNDLIHPNNYGLAGQPHDTWTKLRAEAPVFYCDTDYCEPFYAITRHADIMDISGKPGIFSNIEGPTVFTPAQRRMRENRDGTGFGNMKTIIEMDPPKHREFRKVASGFFTPRNIHHLDDIVAECAREQVDKLGREGETDFVEAIAQRHPLRVLGTILGVEREDEDLMLRLTQELFASEDPDLQRAGEDREAASASLGADFMQLFTRIIQDRRANPRDDLASLLANAKMEDGSPMGPIETFGYFLIVFTAGHDTTRNAISGGMQALLEHPDQLAKLCANPDLSKSAVEEIVRWTSPVNYMKRYLLEDVELNGVQMRRGEQLAMFYGSANRDEKVFDRPFEFDITRHPNRHLGFGTGEHFCLGAHVARLSSRALFLELARRIEVMEPAGDPTHIASSFVVGLKTLPIRYRLRPAA
ncbi:MAG: cytochrome P450 [Spirochaetaceae bacterium]|nr:cytochrome P450 [Myxococcales bacterium]MCB9724318.1 cytochrome P450 [Spirochaetaceae bacterium]HPG26329.1 cytochrome P450 [Myxococcota bacterium]